MQGRWLRTNQCLGMVLLIGAGALLPWLNTDPGFHRELFDGFSLGYVPPSGLILVMICSAMMMCDGRRKEPAATDEVTSLPVLAACAGVVAGGAIYTYALPVLGFLLATPVFLVIAAMLLGMKYGRVVLTASIAATLFVYCMFRFIGFPPPAGLLPF